MGKGNKKVQDFSQSQATTAAQHMSDDRNRVLNNPLRAALQASYDKRRAWIEGKNYSTPPPEMFIYGLNDPAKRAQMREANMNLNRTGASALGFANANPTMLALSRQKMDAQNDQDQAAHYEDAVNAYIGQTDAIGQNLLASDYGRDNMLMGNALARYGQSLGAWERTANTPSPWWGIAGAAIGGLSGMVKGRYGG